MNSNFEFTIPRMRFTTGTAIIFGLGARLLVEKHQRGAFLHQTGTLNVASLHSNTILVGLWQGVMLHQIIMEMPRWIAGVAFAIGARFVVELWLMDRKTLMSGVLGIALGALGADLLAQIWDDESWMTEARCRICGSRHHKLGYHQPAKRMRRRTSVRKEVDWEVKEFVKPMTPMEREIRAIELKALEADSNRSRLEEERKWVEETGNVARAFQIAWQIRRYEGLVQNLTQKAKEMRRLAVQLDLSSPTEQLNILPLHPVKPPFPQLVQAYQPQLPQLPFISKDRGMTPYQPPQPHHPQPLTKFVAVESIATPPESSNSESQDTYRAYAPRPSHKVREYVVEKLGSADGGVEWTRASYRTRRRLPGETDDDETAMRSSVSSRLIPITSVSSLE